MEEINTAGGIDGREVQLIVKDDKGDTAVAAQMHQEFKDEGIELVVGHLMSSMAEPMMTHANEELLFLSPSMSTEALSQQDDYILRSSPTDFGQAAALMADFQQRGIQSYAVVYDARNALYAETLAKYVKDLADDAGLEQVLQVALTEEAYSYETIASQIIDHDPQGVLLISSSIDTAFIAQHLRNQESEVVLWSVSWSMTRDLIENGGSAVEGVRLVGVLNVKEPRAQYTQYHGEFTERFGYEPTFISELANDAMGVMLQAIEAAGSTEPKRIKEALIGLKYEGLKETFTIDPYGDSTRQYSIYTVVDGAFETDWK